LAIPRLMGAWTPYTSYSTKEGRELTDKLTTDNTGRSTC
jgi:hypothetical protein